MEDASEECGLGPHVFFPLCATATHHVVALFIWRSIACLYMFGNVVQQMVRANQIDNFMSWFSFLSNWGYSFVLFYFAGATAVTAGALSRARAGQGRWVALAGQAASPLCRFTLLCLDLALCLEIVIVVLAWSVLLPARGISKAQMHDFYFWWLNLNVHLGAFLLIGAEFLVLTRTPVVPVHGMILGAVVLVYGFGVNLPVSLLYFPPYKIMTWRDWRTPLLLLVALAAEGLAWALVTCVRGRCRRRGPGLDEAEGAECDRKAVATEHGTGLRKVPFPDEAEDEEQTTTAPASLSS